MRFRDKIRATLRDQMLATAADLVVKKGCDNIRIEEVAAACGLAKGTVYLHFKNRDELLGAAVNRLDSQLAARLAMPPDHIDRPVNALRWAVMESVDAQIATLCGEGSAATSQDHRWPCCHRRAPCPYQGGSRTLIAVARHASHVRARSVFRAGEIAFFLLVGSASRLRHAASAPNPKAHRQLVRRLFDDLVAFKRSRTHQQSR
jgi:AcrR family transcriptional regulator